MKKFVFISTSGEPRYTVTPSVEDTYYDGQIIVDHICVEIPMDWNEHELMRSSFWSFNDRCWKQRTPRSYSYQVWDELSESWTDNRSIEDIKLQKNLEINQARLSANRTSFKFQDKDISCDELSRSDIDGVNGIVSITGQLPNDWIGAWKAIDNTLVQIPDVETWKQFYSAMVEQGQRNFLIAQSLKNLLAAATTIEEVEAIKWPT